MDLFTARWRQRDGWSAPLPAWDGPGTLVVVFGGADLLDDDAPLRAVVDAFPLSSMIGCSTSGEILGAEVEDGSLALAVARFEHTSLVVEAAPVSEASSADTGRTLGKRLREHGTDLAAVFVLSDGLRVNGSSLADGLTSGVGGSAVITGGLAGDGIHFGRTWVLVEGRPQESYATAVGLYGTAVEVGQGSDSGWTMLGPERVVTRSEGNVLYELDGLPALKVYTSYLGDRASGLPATALLFPLSVRAGEAEDREFVRTVLAVDESLQSMTFAGDVPEGWTAQLMRATTGRLVDASRIAAVSARLPDDEPSLAIAVSGVGRRLYLGQRVEDELEAVARGLGPSCSLVGFYSYGELAPGPAGGSDLNNQTMTVTVLRERQA